MARILVIDAGAPVLQRVRTSLAQQGHELVHTDDGANGLRLAHDRAPDLILLDAGLASTDAMFLCRSLRRLGDSTPILLVCGAEESDRILGLDLGADDCVPRQCCHREVLARVRALLRRRRLLTVPQPFRFDNTVVDFHKRRVLRDGQPVPLTMREFDLLRCLIEHRHEVMSRRAILTEVWGSAADVFYRTVDSHVAHLRCKLERDPAKPRHIVSVRGIGYSFDA